MSLRTWGSASWTCAGRPIEIGIRLALGARKRSVVTNVLGRSLRLTTIGLVIGVAISLVASGILSSMLYGVAPRNPLNLAIVAAGLALVAVLATLASALSALRADPVEALRTE